MSEKLNSTTVSTTAIPLNSVQSTPILTTLKHGFSVKTMHQRRHEKEAAAKALHEFNHHEELMMLRYRHPEVHNGNHTQVQSGTHSTVKNDAVHRNPFSKQNKPRKDLFVFWFSCSNIETCVALTALATSLTCTLFIFGIVMMWFRWKQSKRKFSADEWWKQSAATPLLLVPSLKDDDDDQPQAKTEDLLRLRKYLKKYMAISQARKQKAADMPDIPEEASTIQPAQDLTTASLKDVPSTMSKKQNNAEAKSIISQNSAIQDNISANDSSSIKNTASKSSQN